MHTKTNTQNDAYQCFTQIYPMWATSCKSRFIIVGASIFTMLFAWSFHFLLLFFETKSYDHCRLLVNLLLEDDSLLNVIPKAQSHVSFLQSIFFGTTSCLLFIMAIMSSTSSSSMAIILSMFLKHYVDFRMHSILTHIATILSMEFIMLCRLHILYTLTPLGRKTHEMGINLSILLKTIL